MAERKTGQEPALDHLLVGRLLLGALSEHEQRQFVARLLRVDDSLREEIKPFLAPFVVEDQERFGRFEAALASGGDSDCARVSLLYEESPGQLDKIIRAFSFDDLFELGETCRRVFSWTMAELLLRRAQSDEVDLASRRTSFFMATMVTDGMEILIAAGVLPPHPRAIADLRLRLESTGVALRPAREAVVFTRRKPRLKNGKGKYGVN